MKIKKIKKCNLKIPEYVYDLQVSSKENPTFICEGVIVHNSDICQYLSDRVWYYDHPEESTLPGEITPPAHEHCRSTTSPITKKAEDIEDLSETIIAAGGLTELLNGELSKKQTYYQWFIEQPEKTKEEVLGSVRYAMYKKGELKVEQFYTADNRFYTLAELNKMGYKIPKEYIQYIK